jgi:hypothetical protein
MRNTLPWLYPPPCNQKYKFGWPPCPPSWLCNMWMVPLLVWSLKMMLQRIKFLKLRLLPTISYIPYMWFFRFSDFSTFPGTNPRRSVDVDPKRFLGVWGHFEQCFYSSIFSIFIQSSFFPRLNFSFLFSSCHLRRQHFSFISLSFFWFPFYAVFVLVNEAL